MNSLARGDVDAPVPAGDVDARSGWRSGADLALRIVGGLTAAWGAVVLAALGVFFTPLYAGSVRVPLSLLLAVLGNAAAIWFAWRTTGHRGAALAPGVLWLLVVAFFGLGRTEGDLGLVQQNWVALLYLLAGAVTVGVAAFRLVISPGGMPRAVPAEPSKIRITGRDSEQTRSPHR